MGTSVLEEHTASILRVEVSQVGKVVRYIGAGWKINCSWRMCVMRAKNGEDEDGQMDQWEPRSAKGSNCMTGRSGGTNSPFTWHGRKSDKDPFSQSLKAEKKETFSRPWAEKGQVKTCPSK
jgi:hypothetical protein